MGCKQDAPAWERSYEDEEVEFRREQWPHKQTHAWLTSDLKLPEIRGPWLNTYSGIQFSIFGPTMEMFDVRDVAHGLSNMNRFNGHTEEPYSVAQHCVVMHDYLKARAPAYNDQYAKKTVLGWAPEALFHDGSEAYIGDVVSPLKKSLKEYKPIEERVEEMMAKAFGLTFPWPALIKETDMGMLATEARDLFKGQRAMWTNMPEPFDFEIVPWGHKKAEAEFLNRCYLLKSVGFTMRGI